MTGACKAATQQEIAVAMNKVNRHRQGAQGIGNLLMQRIGIVIAYPGFKQIAENIERVAVRSFAR